MNGGSPVDGASLGSGRQTRSARSAHSQSSPLPTLSYRPIDPASRSQVQQRREQGVRVPDAGRPSTIPTPPSPPSDHSDPHGLRFPEAELKP